MNYIWDLAIKVRRQGMESKQITFVPSKSFSPYMELSFENINTAFLGPAPEVEINPYYRFCDIFNTFLDVNFIEHGELKRGFFNIIIHYLLFLDCQQGLNKREYYSKFIRKDIENGIFGQDIKENITAFTMDEYHILLSSMIALYQTSASFHLFKMIIRKIFPGSFIYYRSEETVELLIYLGAEETLTNRQKAQSLLALFMPLGFGVRLYWEKHFGIINMEQTMHMDNIVIY